MADSGEPSNNPSIFRNNNALSLALGVEASLDVANITSLDRITQAPQDALSSTATSSAMIFSTDDDSAMTKPTSASTSRPMVSSAPKWKGKQRTGYASSLEGTHGSASETEAMRRFLCKANLTAVGDWATAELHSTRLLRGSARVKDRDPKRHRSKVKKPIFLLGQSAHVPGDDPEPDKLLTLTLPTYGGTLVQSSSDALEQPRIDGSPCLLEEGRHTSAHGKRLSQVRKYIIFGLITLMGCTAITAGYVIHLTGRTRLSCTRCTIFAATVVLASLTIPAMLIARRAMSEALLAGLLELVFGFALVAELKDFV
ncbi:hypothetical protein FB567DRAFT_173776 [Paraphoma chrysanthemicola]|uniref:Transmembrane protein n=1 Tax=Paraphoma chrysanthemicola TaxID=798071 RepID=A0A8K0RF10_9PLEO|nr:hypothetical protein FB567DRAFT_173776 [Paraphoma chrysanthemicola]